MADTVEGMRWEGDFTQWRVELEKNRQHLQQVRSEITKLIKTSDDWTEGTKKRVIDLTKIENDLYNVRQRLFQQMKAMRAEAASGSYGLKQEPWRTGKAAGEYGLAPGPAAPAPPPWNANANADLIRQSVWGVGSTRDLEAGARAAKNFTDYMRSGQMQTLAMAFAIDDLMTVMAQQGGTKGFINGLAAAANNMSLLLAGFHPMLAILPAFGVLLLKAWNAPSQAINDTLKEQISLIRTSAKEIDGLVSKRRELEVGQKVADVEVKGKEFMQKVAEMEARVREHQQKQRDLVDEIGFGQMFMFGLNAAKGGKGMQQQIDDHMAAIKGAHGLEQAQRHQIKIFIEEQEKLWQAEKDKMKKQEFGGDAKRKAELDAELNRLDAQLHDVKSGRRVPNRVLRGLQKDKEKVQAEKERLDIKLDAKGMEERLDENNRILEAIEKNLKAANRPGFVTPKPKEVGGAQGRGVGKGNQALKP